MTKPMTRVAVAAGIALALAGLGHAGGLDRDVARLLDGGSGDDWAGYGGTFGEQHYSPLDQINAATVGKLGLAWSIDLPASNPMGEPLEVDGTIYYTTGYSVIHAADARTGKTLWSYDPKVWEVAGHKLGTAWGSRGIAWWKGKIYTGTQDGRLIAIDAKTGKPLWSQMTISPDDYNYITGAPRVFDGKVIIGFGGADVGHARGYVSTYDAETGKLLWRWYTVPGDPAKGFENEAMEKAAKTWSGTWWKWGGGGTVWNAMTYDPETDTIFLGTGNGSPWNHKARSEGKGDNLYLCSIVALDGKTGTYKWHYQINPGESWDYNAAMDMPLATLTIDGKPRKVIMQAPKNGFFYVIDRETGKLISAEPFAKVTWASKIDMATGRPVENPLARYDDGKTFNLWPSGAGAHGWYPMAASPRTGLVYIPVMERAADMYDIGVKDGSWFKNSPEGTGQTAAMAAYSDSTVRPNHSSRIDAWDPVTQTRVWTQPNAGNQGGGVLATGGDLVFQGQLDGHFRAFDAKSGKLLWSFDAKAPVIAPPISYRVGGRQYVSVQTGFSLAGSMSGKQLEPFRIDYRTQARRLLTFAIGGTKHLPPKAPDTLVPVADPDFRPDAAAEQRGTMIFHGRCLQCHGINAIAGGAAPDLRTSAIPQSAEAFKAVVHGGALLENGMPRFDWASDAQLDDLRQYIRAQAAAWRAGKKGG